MAVFFPEFESTGGRDPLFPDSQGVSMPGVHLLIDRYGTYDVLFFRPISGLGSQGSDVLRPRANSGWSLIRWREMDRFPTGLDWPLTAYPVGFSGEISLDLLPYEIGFSLTAQVAVLERYGNHTYPWCEGYIEKLYELCLESTGRRNIAPSAHAWEIDSPHQERCRFLIQIDGSILDPDNNGPFIEVVITWYEAGRVPSLEPNGVRRNNGEVYHGSKFRHYNKQWKRVIVWTGKPNTIIVGGEGHLIWSYVVVCENDDLRQEIERKIREQTDLLLFEDFNSNFIFNAEQYSYTLAAGTLQVNPPLIRGEITLGVSFAQNTLGQTPTALATTLGRIPSLYEITLDAISDPGQEEIYGQSLGKHHYYAAYKIFGQRFGFPWLPVSEFMQLWSNSARNGDFRFSTRLVPDQEIIDRIDQQRLEDPGVWWMTTDIARLIILEEKLDRLSGVVGIFGTNSAAGDIEIIDMSDPSFEPADYHVFNANPYAPIPLSLVGFNSTEGEAPKGLLVKPMTHRLTEDEFGDDSVLRNPAYVVHSLPQLLQVLMLEINAALTLTELSANIVPSADGSGGSAKISGLFSLLGQIAYTASAIDDTSRQSLISSAVTQLGVKELMRVKGFPRTIKDQKIQVGDQVFSMPFEGFRPDSPTEWSQFAQLAAAVGYVLASVAKPQGVGDGVSP